MNRISRPSGVAVGTTVVFGLLATAIFAVLALTVLGPIGWPAVIVLLAAAGATVAALAVPVHVLPALALVAFVIVPVRLTPTDLTQRVPLWAVVLVVWVLRRFLTPRKPSESTGLSARSGALGWRILAYTAALGFLIWSIFASVRSIDHRLSVGWTVSMAACAFLPMLVLDAREEARLLRRAWVVAAGITGAYAVVELALQSNPVYDAIYNAVGTSNLQHWVLHRAEAGYGHPLLAGTFFAVAAVLGIGSWLDSRRRSDLIWGILAAAGTVATVSRGPMLALGVGIALSLVAWVVANPARSVVKPVVFGLLGVVAAIGVLNSAPVTARTDSVDATRSAGVRDSAVSVAFESAASTNWLGSGPGTSGIAGRLLKDIIIESSALQLLISVGIPGLVLFALFLIGAGLTALSGRDIPAAAALATLTICIVGYNAIDAVRPIHLIIGFLVIIVMNPPHLRSTQVAVPETVQAGIGDPVVPAGKTA